MWRSLCRFPRNAQWVNFLGTSCIECDPLGCKRGKYWNNLIYALKLSSSFTASIFTVIIFLKGITWRSLIPNFTYIGQEVLKWRAASCSLRQATCGFQCTDFHETHACLTTCCEQLLYWIQRKPDRRFSRRYEATDGRPDVVCT